MRKRKKGFVVLGMAAAMLASSTFSVSAAGLRDVFSAEYYAENYEDLKIAFGEDEEALYQHFIVSGLKENRQMSPILDVQAYREAYQDLDAAFGDDWDAYVEHFFTQGAREGRTAGVLFDPVKYAEAYPDVAAAFGDDLRAVTRHFLDYGMKEGKTAGVVGKETLENSGRESGRSGGDTFDRPMTGYGKDFVIEGTKFVKYNGTDSVVFIPDGITQIGERAFQDNSYVEKIVLSDSVESVGKMAFAYMENLREFHVGANLSSYYTCIFSATPKLQTFHVSPSNNSFYVQDGVLRTKSSVINFYPAGKTDSYYKIPEGVTSINFNANRYLERVYIPASVSQINLSCTSNLKYIEVAPDSSYFCAVDNVLYNREMTELIRYPSGKTDSYFIVPENVILDSDSYTEIFPNTSYLTDIYFGGACPNRTGMSSPFYRWYCAFESTRIHATDYYWLMCGDKMSDKVYRIHYPQREKESWAKLEQQYEKKWGMGQYFELEFIAESSDAMLSH